jgi:hypothetical protein
VMSMERMVEKALTSLRAPEPRPLDCIHICLGFASPSGLPAAGCLPAVGSNERQRARLQRQIRRWTSTPSVF